MLRFAAAARIGVAVTTVITFSQIGSPSHASALPSSQGTSSSGPSHVVLLTVIASITAVIAAAIPTMLTAFLNRKAAAPPPVTPAVTTDVRTNDPEQAVRVLTSLLSERNGEIEHAYIENAELRTEVAALRTEVAELRRELRRRNRPPLGGASRATQA